MSRVFIPIHSSLDALSHVFWTWPDQLNRLEAEDVERVQNTQLSSDFVKPKMYVN